MEPKKQRIFELDLFRGIAVILMIFDHFMYNVAFLMPMIFIDYPPAEGFFREFFRFGRFYWSWDVRNIVRPIIIFVFLALTGICCSFSRSNLKRGLKLLLVAMGLTVATFIIGEVMGDIDMMITFGILHCIALALILEGLVERLTQNKWVFLAIGIVAVAVGTALSWNIIFESYVGNNIFLMILKQMLGLSLCGGDSFSLILYGGQIFIGVFLGKQLYPKRESLFHAKYHRNPVNFVGRHSLVVYFLHQIILPVLMIAILLICGFTFSL